MEPSTELQKSESGFEEQFKNPKYVEVNGAKVKFVDLMPEHPVSNIPIFLAPGWVEGTTTYHDAVKYIFEQGYHVITLDHPRRGDKAKPILRETPNSLNNQTKPQEIRRAEARKVQNMLGVIEALGLSKVDAIAHSEGAIYTAIAAEQNPNLFRNIVLVSPAGMTGLDTVRSEVLRFGKLSAMETVSAIKDKFQTLPIIRKKSSDNKIVKNPDSPRPHDNAAIGYVAANPLRALEEVRAIVKSDIYSVLENLRNKNIGITVIQGVSDPLVEPQKMFDESRDKSSMPSTGFYSVTHGHNTLARDERYVNAALDALKSLNFKNSLKKIKVNTR